MSGELGANYSLGEISPLAAGARAQQRNAQDWRDSFVRPDAQNFAQMQRDRNTCPYCGHLKTSSHCQNTHA